MRETQFRVEDHAAQVPSGAYMLAGGTAMDDLLDRLHNGDATLGWEGDPRLCLAFNRETDRWEMWRFEHDSQYRLVGVSKTGCGFPPDTIQNLVSKDGRRGYDVVKDVERHNQMTTALADSKFGQATSAGAEKLAWALQKDLA